MTKNAQTCNIRNTKQVNEKLGKRADYLMFDWVQFMSKEYFGVIDALMNVTGKCWRLVNARRFFNMLMGISVNY